MKGELAVLVAGPVQSHERARTFFECIVAVRDAEAKVFVNPIAPGATRESVRLIFNDSVEGESIAPRACPLVLEMDPEVADSVVQALTRALVRHRAKRDAV